MRVQIRLFATLRERAGADSLTLELPDGARVGDALGELRWLTGDLRTVLAVNRDYASAETVLQADDELALIPPVSGGAVDSALHVRISSEPLSQDALVARCERSARRRDRDLPRRDPRGARRSSTRPTPRWLRPRSEEIAAAAAERHGLCAVAVEHRIGTVPLSEPSVVIAVSAPHRAEAFAGAREIIDDAQGRGADLEARGGRVGQRATSRLSGHPVG